VFDIQGETRITVNYAGKQETVTAYVVSENEITKSILLGMDSLLALQGRLLNKEGNGKMNPNFPISGEDRLSTPRPIFATGLTASFASLTWQRQFAYVIKPRNRKYHQDLVTNTTFRILGKFDCPLAYGRPLQCVDYKYQHTIHFRLRLHTTIWFPN
jgi:hypothetical protein